MWHPVGALPAAVYWRRRLVVLTLVLAVLGGAGWLAFTLLSGRFDGQDASSAPPPATPALEQVLPALTGVATPSPPSLPVASEPAASEPVATEPVAEAAPVVPDPVAGGPCTDDMIGFEVRTPGTAAVGSKPTFELLVSNVSAVPCVRALDKGLQEFLLLDPAGNRLWGSNDCFPEVSSEPRTLAPGEVVAIPVLWGGLTSEPTCTVARTAPPPGSYVVRGRLDTKVSADAPLTLL